MTNDQRKFYSKDSHFLGNAKDARLECIIRFLHRNLAPLSPSSTLQVLDVGCANGIVLRSLPDTWRRVGIDITEELLSLAREDGVETHVCDFDNHPFPFPNETFDLVIANDVIEHVLHTDAVLNEVNRVLKPSGRLFISIPNVNQPISLLMQFLLDLTPMFAARYRCPHYRDFTHRLFRQILGIHGFNVERCAGTFIYPWDRSRLSKAVASWLPRWATQILYWGAKRESIVIDEGFAPNMPELLRWLDSTKR
jgi:2-polyprenyl-3-methyl-5-hydroxy-6-metoxy-1,4-benzoquinol methylase